MGIFIAKPANMALQWIKIYVFFSLAILEPHITTSVAQGFSFALVEKVPGIIAGRAKLEFFFLN